MVISVDTMARTPSPMAPVMVKPLRVALLTSSNVTPLSSPAALMVAPGRPTRWIDLLISTPVVIVGWALELVAIGIKPV